MLPFSLPRWCGRSFSTVLVLVLYLVIPAWSAELRRDMLIVISEPGGQLYETEFRRQGEAWKAMAEKGGFTTTVIGMDAVEDDGDRAKLEKAITSIPREGGDLWLVWIGHGSFDGRTANFNLRGPDLSSVELGKWLAPIQRRMIILNLFSASSPFLKELSAENRVIIGATRSDGERNYIRFGAAMADALTAADSDLDRDGAVSLIETTLTASAKVRAFYEDAQRVMQEHAVIDDNGDGSGTPAETFKGLRAGVKGPDGKPADGMVAREIFFLKPSVDPLDAAAREKRAALEAQIDALREKKKNFQEDEYYRQLEVLMRRMAELYDAGR